jgi:protein AroM
LAAPTQLRIAFLTIGQAPRDDVVPELMAMLDVGHDRIRCDQFGALDGLTEAEIAAHPPGPHEGQLYTRLASGDHIVVGAGFVSRRLEPLLRRLDGSGYNLIVLITTGVFQQIRLHTPFVHGQQAVDAWIAGLVMGDCELGLIYPLPQQHREFAHGTLIQNARAVVATGETTRLDAAAERLAHAELILMHSVGYTEAMARQMAELTRKPVVTARRIIAAAMRIHLADIAASSTVGPPNPTAERTDLPAALMDRLPQAMKLLTPREHDVLACMLEGYGNKAIGRHLGISHRTVEIHRARALAKLNAGSSTELIRRVLITGHRDS